MHEVGVIHRDLKLDNILVNDKMEIKITDFGLSTYNDHETPTYAGTYPFMAPEVTNRATYDGFAADVFSLGVLLFVMVAGTFPFQRATVNDKIYKLLTKGTLDSEFWQSTRTVELSDNFKDLFSSMISFNPKSRPTLSEIENHRWFKTSFKNEEEARNKLVKSIDWKWHKYKLSL
jgi:serine/threonine protein kinase